jgi:hypothetical protein
LAAAEAKAISGTAPGPTSPHEKDACRGVICLFALMLPASTHRMLWTIAIAIWCYPLLALACAKVGVSSAIFD